MGKKITREDFVTVRLTSQEREILKQKASKIGLSMSAYIRMIILSK